MNREVEELDRQYRRLTQFITEALGYGDTNIGTEESPLIVEVSDTVRIVDPDYPDADPPLEWAVEYIERELGIVGNFLAPGARPEEDEALRDSIATHGVQLPILVDHCGNIIDGRRRNRICQELGLPCPAIVVGALSLEQKKQLAMELNTCRTQLTRRQKQHIAVELLKCDARDSDRVIGRIAGLDHTTVGPIRRRLVADGAIRQVRERRGRDGKKYTRRIVASDEKGRKTALQVIGNIRPNGKIIDVHTAEKRSRRMEAEAKKNRRHFGRPLPDDAIQLYHCRFQELDARAGLLPDTVKLILTDIPYQPEFIPQLEVLAALGNRVLVTGGLFVTHTGHEWLDQKFIQLSKHLTYRWQMASAWPTGPAVHYHPLHLLNRWGPIVIYSKGPWVPERGWCDLSLPTGPEKDYHEWQKTLGEIKTLVEYFTNEGDLVVDPCGGGFTTAVACYLLNRRCISCDISDECVQRGLERLANVRQENNGGNGTVIPG